MIFAIQAAGVTRPYFFHRFSFFCQALLWFYLKRASFLHFLVFLLSFIVVLLEMYPFFMKIWRKRLELVWGRQPLFVFQTSKKKISSNMQQQHVGGLLLLVSVLSLQRGLGVAGIFVGVVKCWCWCSSWS